MSWKSVASLFAIFGMFAMRSGARPITFIADPGASCSRLERLSFEGNTTVTAATIVSGGTLKISANQTLNKLPEFCRVIGVSKPTKDSSINFEVWLPVNGWNGKFLSVGEGGFAGVLA